LPELSERGGGCFEDLIYFNEEERQTERQTERERQREEERGGGGGGGHIL
jgi:hypothetical protein